MPRLSVIIITKNEAHNIGACLDSVSFADERIVIDSGSSDATVAICQKYTDKILVTNWPGDGPQKNRALAMATGDWILCLDADERVTHALKKEILSTIQHTNKHGFTIPYISTYCGKPLYCGDWRGEKHLRLFRRSYGIFSQDVVHCHVQLKGTLGALQSPILHHPFRNLETLLAKMNDYSTGSAQRKLEQGKHASIWTALTHGIWAFVRGYFLKLGFLDGREGFMLAVSNAEGTYYRYLKLMLLAEKKNDATSTRLNVSPRFRSKT
ncbi:MAG TPA: glycosyltransferase family 2 protein [Gammaproteobacteria bacterium]|nr:glycosyltransferase family 2 protein [Gammaproteobacteria bacterium]